MLLPDNIKPELSIYFNGALVIKELRKSNEQPLMQLYGNLKKTGMSFSVFMLCLDWLYLMDIAIIDEEGRVSLCI